MTLCRSAGLAKQFVHHLDMDAQLSGDVGNGSARCAFCRDPSGAGLSPAPHLFAVVLDLLACAAIGISEGQRAQVVVRHGFKGTP